MESEYLFELDKWNSRYESELLDGTIGQPSNGIMSFFDSVVSPIDLVHLEGIRNGSSSNTPVDVNPVDLFVFAKGEPELRHVTKIGGLPYRSANSPWPKCSETNDPKTFLAQFFFRNSKDIVGELPGDILLIFADDESFSTPDALSFEWVNLGTTDLVKEVDVPPPSWDFVSAFGYRYRTYESRVINKYRKEDSIKGTKICGNRMSKDGQNFNPVLLVEIANVIPHFDVSFPWINRPDPLQPGTITDSEMLMIVDSAVLSVFVDAELNLSWTITF